MALCVSEKSVISAEVAMRLEARSLQRLVCALLRGARCIPVLAVARSGVSHFPAEVALRLVSG